MAAFVLLGTQSTKAAKHSATVAEPLGVPAFDPGPQASWTVLKNPPFKPVKFGPAPGFEPAGFSPGDTTISGGSTVPSTAANLEVDSVVGSTILKFAKFTESLNQVSPAATYFKAPLDTPEHLRHATGLVGEAWDNAIAAHHRAMAWRAWVDWYMDQPPGRRGPPSSAGPVCRVPHGRLPFTRLRRRPLARVCRAPCVAYRADT
jgi:hypothetical protein